MEPLQALSTHLAAGSGLGSRSRLGLKPFGLALLLSDGLCLDTTCGCDMTAGSGAQEDPEMELTHCTSDTEL